jgi:ATP/maltotriose-dependent transcriptional regulator MalT
MWYTQGELERARTALTRAIALAQGAGDILVVVLAENLLAHVAYAEGQLDEARERFVRSVTGFRALGLSWGTGNSLSGLAWVALASGDTGQAVRLLDEATVVLQASGPWFVLLPLYVRAILAVRRKDASQAIALARDSLMRVRDLQDKFAFVYALVPLAGAAVLRGYDAWAARILGVRDAVTERTGATVVDQAVLDLREEAERGVRARLGPDRWARAYATGYRMSVDALLRDIDQVAAELDRHLSSSGEPGPRAGLR